MCVNLPVFFSQGYRGLFVVSIDRAWFVDYTFVIFEKNGWIITNILAKKSSIFEAKRYCARPFLVITFHAAAHETVLPPLFRIRFRRSRTLGSGCDLRFPPLPASSFIVFLISVIDIHVSGDVRCRCVYLPPRR